MKLLIKLAVVGLLANAAWRLGAEYLTHYRFSDSVQEASIVRDKALAVGFQGTEIQANTCGVVQVAVGGIPTLEVGRAFAEQARSVGFEVTLVQAD